jgi:putative effector of murein hydrolase
MTAAAASLAALAASLAAYLLARWLHLRLGAPALLHPALVACLGLGAALALLGIDHADYFAAARPLHAALLPMTVLLAVPLHRHRALIRAALGPLAVTVAVGGGAAILLSAGPAVLAGVPEALGLTLAAKSVTTAVAVGIAERVGGIPDLAPAIVIATGIAGACLGPTVCRRLGIHDDRAVGLALGIAAHAIGTARAFQISGTAGAFASLGLILNALLTSAAVAFASAFA